MGRLIDADKVRNEYIHAITLEMDAADLLDMLCNIIDNAPTVEAIPKADYENRLKADLEAILVELQLEIREHDPGCGWEGYADKNVIDCIIQERINALEGEQDPTPQI